jgi:3'-phosphoadenosine 5'-phosphosulfate sulfotransferase (PAPS reductase)/FAD synthetase
MSIIHVVSVSSGIDSQATLEIAVERFGAHRVVGIFCDTDNEDQAVYAHLDYLECEIGVRIYRLKADFSEQIADKRKFVARDVRTGREYDTKPVFEVDGKTPVWKRDGFGNIVMKKGKPVQKTVKIGGGRRRRWSNKAKRRALSVLYPTGNAFLDLCIWKGRFPSRKAQFCTEELKRNIAIEFQLGLLDQGHSVVSWQGVRRDESEARKDVPKFESLGGRMFIYRPIVDKTKPEVFAYCAARGRAPNPLYLEGCDRVGCAPCINSKKEEIRQTNLRRRHHLVRISDWEHTVSMASKRGYSTFFHKVDDQGGERAARIFSRNEVWQVVQWAQTTRGGKQFSLLHDLDEPTGCSSSYGLCDQVAA